jgi:hypothetical protein
MGGDLNRFQDNWAPLVYEWHNYSVWPKSAYHQMLHDPRNNTIYSLIVVISTVFNIHVLEHLWFQGCGTTPYDNDYIPPDATWHKKQEYIWIRGGESQQFSKYLGTSCFKGVRVYTVWSWPTCHLMLLDTRNKNIIYSLEVDNPTLLKIFKEFPYCAPIRSSATMTLTNLY